MVSVSISVESLASVSPSKGACPMSVVMKEAWSLSVVLKKALPLVSHNNGVSFVSSSEADVVSVSISEGGLASQ